MIIDAIDPPRIDFVIEFSLDVSALIPAFTAAFCFSVMSAIGSLGFLK